MSELSAQCDELRAMAESVGLEVPQAATLMMDAADTILSLRDRAQDLQAENEQLRELVKDFFDVPCQCLKCEHYDYEEDRCDLRDRARELGVEVDG